MRAVVCEAFGPPEALREVTLPRPVPQADEVLVRVTATGVGYVDGLLIAGQYQVKPALPFYPCSEFAGEVAAVGADVSYVEVGQRVFGSAGAALADFIVAKRSQCFPAPDSLADAQAASLFINYLTALYGLDACGRLHPGETVLVLGAAGGVGSAAVAVAKALGARVVAAASNEAKRSAALATGADAVVDYGDSQWREDLRAQCPDGLDLVYDPVGGQVTEPALRSLAPGGRFLVVGFASGQIPKVALNLALLKRCSIVGVDWGGQARANPGINQRLMTQLLDLLASGRLAVAAVTERSAAQFVRAFEDQLAGRIVGKLVLTR